MFFLYKILTTILFPLFILVIYLRKIFGKEDPIRFKEKILPRYQKFKKNYNKNIWFHGASLGELLSVVPLINYLLKENDKINILITSTTISSAKMIEKQFKGNNRVVHNFFPLDFSFLIKKFLNNFKPDLAIFIDSEIWPNFLNQIKKNKIKLILINARITKKTLNRWLLIRKFAQHIFSLFDLCIASSEDSFKNLEILKVNNKKYFGNLKYAPNKRYIPSLKKETIQYFNIHKVWLAANTHSDEEVFCINTNFKIKKEFKNTLLIIIPRHINRIPSISKYCKIKNLKYQIISTEEEIINEGTEILLINSFGVLSKYFNYCKDVFIGKSMEKKLILVGGQNPLEAARLGCNIYHGPYVYNFQEIYKFLKTNNISYEINNEEELAEKIKTSFNGLPLKKLENVDNIDKYGKSILKETAKELNKFI